MSAPGARARAGRPTAPFAAAAAAAVALALAPPALGRTARSSGGSAQPKPPVSATLEHCVTSAEQAERSATFSGEMASIPGSAKMEMRIDVLERLPSEPTFHVVSAPGLGVWRWAAQGVKSYRYLKEVTNLAAPAFYRGDVRFRWLNAKGKLIKSYELRTPRCAQPLVPPEAHKSEEAAHAA